MPPKTVEGLDLRCNRDELGRALPSSGVRFQIQPFPSLSLLSLSASWRPMAPASLKAGSLGQDTNAAVTAPQRAREALPGVPSVWGTPFRRVPVHAGRARQGRRGLGSGPRVRRAPYGPLPPTAWGKDRPGPRRAARLSQSARPLRRAPALQ